MTYAKNCGAELDNLTKKVNKKPPSMQEYLEAWGETSKVTISYLSQRHSLQEHHRHERLYLEPPQRMPLEPR